VSEQTEQPDKTRIITMTDRAPVRIVERNWPVIAKASGDLLDLCILRVRRHMDGRTIVYGVREVVPDGIRRDVEQNKRCIRRGEVLGQTGEAPSGTQLVAAIRRVGEDCGLPASVIRKCIADLPATEI
jgi:hypothetical protein